MPDQNDPGGMAALQQVRPRMPAGNPNDPPLMNWPPRSAPQQAPPQIPGNPNDPPLAQWPPAGPPPRFIQVPVPLWERIMNTVFGPRTPIGTVEQTRRVRVPPQPE